MGLGTYGWMVAALAFASAGCATVVTGQSRYAQRTDLVEVRVSNTLDATACFVWLTPIDADDWGLDWLGPFESVQRGATRSFRLPRGHWDLRAATCDHRDLVVIQSVAVERDGAELSLASPPPPAMRPNPAAHEPTGAGGTQ